MIILGIDPGPETCGWVIYDALARRVLVARNDCENTELLGYLSPRSGAAFYDSNNIVYRPGACAIEMIHNQGQSVVGQSVFSTCVWVGRFAQAWDTNNDRKSALVLRSKVKMEICGTMRAKDANIRQSLIDMLGEPGVKKSPGPTYGVSGHAWQALAVAVTIGG